MTNYICHIWLYLELRFCILTYIVARFDCRLWEVFIYHWGNQSRNPKKNRIYNYQAKHYKKTDNGHSNTTQTHASNCKSGVKLGGINLYALLVSKEEFMLVKSWHTGGNMSVWYWLSQVQCRRFGRWDILSNNGPPMTTLLSRP